MYEYNGQEVSYTIEENGYTIYLGGKPWISQHEPYIPNKALSYEENAIAQIEDIIASAKNSDDEVSTEEMAAAIKEGVNEV